MVDFQIIEKRENRGVTRIYGLSLMTQNSVHFFVAITIPFHFLFYSSFYSMPLFILCLFLFYASFYSMPLFILCLFLFYASFYSMPLFLQGREKRGKERVMATNKCTEFRFIINFNN